MPRGHHNSAFNVQRSTTAVSSRPAISPWMGVVCAIPLHLISSSPRAPSKPCGWPLATLSDLYALMGRNKFAESLPLPSRPLLHIAFTHQSRGVHTTLVCTSFRAQSGSCAVGHPTPQGHIDGHLGGYNGVIHDPPTPVLLFSAFTE